MRPNTRLAGIALALAALVSGGCRQVTPLPPEALTDLTTLESFRQAFNASRDRPRLLILLSPT